MSEKSFIEKIQLKASIKVYIILTILAVLFFTFWYIIKPEEYKKTFGIITAPKDGVLVPVDDSQCGKNIIRCENTNDCVQKCKNEQGDTSNYNCYKVPKDKEIYYLGTKLNEGEKYCIPTDDTGNGEDSVIASCGTYTGRLVRTLKQKDGKASLSWDCQCKYPTYFSGEKCLDQVACKYEYLDQEYGRMKRSMGDLVEFGLDDKPVNIGATGTQYNVLTPDTITRDKYPTATLSNGKPIFRCNCSDTIKTKGAISMPGDYLSCYPDLCNSGRGAGASHFDTEKKECVCGPQMYKSNISGFCYPLEVSSDATDVNSFSNVCKPGLDNICSCGIKFVQEIQEGDKKIYVGLIFRYDNEYYISCVIDNTENIIEDTNKTGQTVFIEISELKPTWIQRLNINGLANLKGSKLETYFESVKKINYNSLTQTQKDKIKNNLNKSLTNSSWQINNIISMLNDEKYSKGKVPMKCNSFYYDRGDKYPTCNSWVGKDVVGNNKLNVLGIACVNFCNLSDPCQTISSNDTTKCLLNPFNSTGYNCECLSDTSKFYYKSVDGKDQCLPQKETCDECEDDNECLPNDDGSRNCTNCHKMENRWIFGHGCKLGARYGPRRCTPTDDINRCSDTNRDDRGGL